MVLIDKKSAAISKLLAQATIKLTNQGSFLCSFLASQAISNPRNAISKRKTSVNYTPHYLVRFACMSKDIHQAFGRENI